jgi:hypothetical protein
MWAVLPAKLCTLKHTFKTQATLPTGTRSKDSREKSTSILYYNLKETYSPDYTSNSTA